MIVFIPSVGKKVSLVRCVKAALQPGDRLIGNDLSPDAPALEFADQTIDLPKFGQLEYARALNEFLERAQVNTIIPTRTQELTFWQAFGETHPNIFVATHGPNTLRNTLTKSRSYDFLKANGLPCAPYAIWANQAPEELTQTLGKLPYFAKPDKGSASIGAFRINNTQQLSKLSHGTIIQPILRGDEYTLNTYTNKKRRCVCVIAHKRVEITHGQVSRGYTVRHEYFQQLGQQLTQALGDTYGPLNFQLFHDPAQGQPSDQNCWITDINPRFGGGYALTHNAGGHFADWVIAEAKQKDLPQSAGLWKENVWLNKP